MYETREGLNKTSNWHAFKTQVIFDLIVLSSWWLLDFFLVEADW